ncbi:MAG: twin-arginine translocase TatA/TatE family subunit [Nitrospiraceae bacterium]|jgi:sec-independent protein translocase protein TatA|nr:MAG: twin-arginine translocase TatA/TatE family subunit [Nitrospiraceae bacterium]
MFGLGVQELLIVLVIILVLFGATRLPEIGRGIGQAIKNFKKATSEPDEIDVTPKKNVSQQNEKEGNDNQKQ